MSTAGLPFPTSNNAPQPIPGGYGNPTGANFGMPASGLPFPNMSSFGSPVYNQGSFTGAGLAGLNSGLFGPTAQGGNWNQNLYNELGRAFGKGAGQTVGNILTQGLFNPQVAAAILNAQQPGIARGEAGIQGAFGDAGARFSSAAALGLGDFESQVQLNQQATLAQMFQNAQNQELSLLSGVLPTLHAEEANRSSGLMRDIIGGLETVGGFAAAPFTGGASLMLAGQGLNTLGGGSMGGGGMMGQNPIMGLQSLFQPNQSAFPGMSPGAISAGFGGPGQVPLQPSAISLPDQLSMQAGSMFQGGETLGIPDSLFGGGNSGDMLSNLFGGSGGDTAFPFGF